MAGGGAPSPFLVACCGGRFYNHVALVNNVYPSEPGEVGPRPSALSLLVFYAGSKPQKLEKVGAYLEVKLKADARRNRNGYLTVTLDILNALVDNCASHINLISKSLLHIVLEVLGNPDPELFIQATTTFVKFCDVHNHDTTLDKEFLELFSTCVDRFCQFATYETNDSVLQQKMHVSGLKAIKAIVSAESFPLIHNHESYINRIVPAILTNIKNKRKRLFAQQQSQPAPISPTLPHTSSPAQAPTDAPATPTHKTDHVTIAEPPSSPPSPSRSAPKRSATAASKRASITDDLFSASEVEHSAEASLRCLASRSSAAALRIVLTRAFEHLDAHDGWSEPPRLVVHVARVLAGACRARHRYVLVSALLERLALPASAPGGRVDAKVGLVRCLGVVLASSLSSGPYAAAGDDAVYTTPTLRVSASLDAVVGAGVSAMELAEALHRQLAASVSAIGAFLPSVGSDTALLPLPQALFVEPLDEPVAGSEGGGERAHHAVLQSALVRCLSALGAGVEYPDQLNDLVAFLVNRLGGAGNEGGAAVTRETRRAVLRCLSGALVARYEAIAGGGPISAGTPGRDWMSSPVSAEAEAASRDELVPGSAAEAGMPDGDEGALPMVVISESSGGFLRSTGGAGRASQALSKRLSLVRRNPFPVTLLAPLVMLVSDDDAEVRYQAARCLHHAWALDAAEGGPSGASIRSGVSGIGTAAGREERIAVGLAKAYIGRFGNGVLAAAAGSAIGGLVPAEYLVFQAASLACVAWGASRGWTLSLTGAVVAGLFWVHEAAGAAAVGEDAQSLRAAHARAARSSCGRALTGCSRVLGISVGGGSVLAELSPRALDEAVEAAGPVRAGVSVSEMAESTGIEAEVDRTAVVESVANAIRLRVDGSADLGVFRKAVAERWRSPPEEAAGDAWLSASGDGEGGMGAVTGSVGGSTPAVSSGVLALARPASSASGRVGPGSNPGLIGSRVPVSYRSASIQKSDAAAATPIKVDDLKEVLAGNASPALTAGRPGSADVPGPSLEALPPSATSADLGVVSVSSAERSRSNVKVLLRNISVNLEITSKRSASPSLQPPSAEAIINPRMSSESPRTRSETTTPSPTLSYSAPQMIPASKRPNGGVPASASSLAGSVSSVNGGLTLKAPTVVTVPPTATGPMVAPVGSGSAGSRLGLRSDGTGTGKESPTLLPVSSVRNMQPVPSSNSLTSLRLAEPKVGAI
ncbi:Protein EFR3 B [Phlyctochytrium bullatum]|nr:Protein EFR3 B [Phlyctochytrium bullatum]